MNTEFLEKYCQFLRIVQNRINEHFEEQKEYICCREGCSFCCQKGNYPCSEAEFNFLKLGFMKLDKETAQTVINKILQIKAEKQKSKEQNFSYECPFLKDNRCSVYEHRMLICRTFGLLYYEDKSTAGEKNIFKMPFCIEKGLNYSSVYNFEKNSLSSELVKKLGYKTDPLAYNLSSEYLMQKFGKEIMNLDFGEVKPLIDWL